MNELDKISEKILKQVLKNDCALTPKGFQNLGLLEKYSQQELSGCLDNLKSLDFIYLDGKSDLLCSTFKARQYFLLKRKKFFNNIVMSFIIPLIIAFVTAYFTAKFTATNELIILTDTINNI